MPSEIIQLPQNGGNQNGGMILPVSNGGGLFGNNGQTSLTDILGFAVIATFGKNERRHCTITKGREERFIVIATANKTE